jgi:hypothetical protein
MTVEKSSFEKKARVVIVTVILAYLLLVAVAYAD